VKAHPAHLTEDQPSLLAPGVRFTIDVFPEPGSRPSCGVLRHTWHRLEYGLLARRRCCQCGVTGTALYGRR
jgi:hypothetical protein